MADNKSLGNEGLIYLVGKIKGLFDSKTVLITEEEYNALSVKDENVLYCIKEET